MIRRPQAAALTLLTLLTLAACESDPAGAGTARLALFLTDAPGDFVSAEVEIREIYFQGGASEDGGGRLTIYSAGEVFDLLGLREGVTAKLSDVVVPAGNYSQLRLVLGEVTIETEGGTIYSTEDGTLVCPSCAQSGLKINLPGGGLRLENGDQSVVVDFDVAQSFGHQAGNSGKWIMHPVIHATLAEAAGKITGEVVLGAEVTLPTCGGAPVTLAIFVPTATFGEIVISGQTNADGDIVFPYVPSGFYTMGIDEEIAFGNGDKLQLTATASPNTVDVDPEDTETVDYTITAATCQAAPPPSS